MSEAIITVEGLGKKYRIQHQAEGRRYVALRDVIAEKAKGFFRGLKLEKLKPEIHVSGQTSGLKSPVSASQPQVSGLKSPTSPRTSTSEDFWALRDVSFEVRRGEVVGIIGRNGAGKSTLLKVLSRITEPTEGRVTLRGRVASLLEVGTGFHPELTGRENIFLNGAILGMHRAEIKSKFDEIVAFAEVEKFLDTPVKRYSSGMYVRLAFAVAAHLEPEILIVDEVLAVGDAQFQKKCLGKMQDVATGGRTVLFVSHNMAAVQGLCQTAIHLERGQVRRTGEVDTIVRDYLRSLAGAVGEGTEKITLGKDLLLRRLDFLTNPIVSGQPLKFALELISHNAIQIKELALLLFSDFGTRIAIVDFRQFGIRSYPLNSEALVIEGTIRDLPLVEGDYRVGIYVVTDQYHGDFFDLAQFSVGARPLSNGVIPYPAVSRGLVELDLATTSFNHIPAPNHDLAAKD
jgi:lipopolysaccharide transport system ATP-binding protein